MSARFRFHAQHVLLVGATGGLGAAFARALAAEGARLILAGRNPAALTALAAELALPVQTQPVDLADPASLAALRDFARTGGQPLDLVVNVTGVDVRKPLDQHTLTEIQNTLAVNLQGAILLTQILLPLMRPGGQIVHVGGFADGRLALPYYSVDVASRAGLYTFIEAMNRELRAEGQTVSLAYFSPSPADTAAERLFRPLWRELGMELVPPAKVAAELLVAIQRRRRVTIMGGWSTRLFAGLNAVAPRWADALLLNHYGQTLKRYFAPATPVTAKAPRAWQRSAGLILVALSFVLYGLLLAVPFVPLALAGKTALTAALIGLGEATFWIGGLLLGKEIITRFRRYLDPRYWFCDRKQTV